MVKIKEVKTVKKTDGTEFYCLVVEGQLETVLSKESGRIYLTKRTAVIPTTLDKDSCNATIGSELKGSIQKVMCDPYNYELEDGSIIELSHRWQFMDENLKVFHEHVVDSGEIIN